MAATAAIKALDLGGINHRVHKYATTSDGAWGPEAVTHMAGAGAVGEQIFKTLVIDVGGTLAVAVIPVPERLSLKAAAAALGLTGKAAMADPKDVMRVTGYVLGGVSPVGQKKALPTVVDDSAHLWDTVFCSAGKRGLEIELAPGDLIAVCGAVVADILA
ncbi:Cys-tRNA(Pro)/Cys-tRNA(Cys) deacylase [Williamsia limnetica]|uniref:Cys-tRNA(Pro)/Cys-tRNA(Cys) deacylase n=1 Tax=Williamsia limnetica TaxID=882452 RepID=A0A318RK48_WILLI|nr:aminoacyl-tRNA deacylase [Williamsia limnetica]PYE14294.1 Cys-tRNA(Pro)/Cys-tRNA(Cys) deacylase [Williamsia limnetica]